MSADDTSQRFAKIISDYLRAVESGNAPDREQLIGEHPDLADELTSFLANHDQMQDVASEDATIALQPFGADARTPPAVNAGEGATIPPSGPPAGSPKSGETKVQYFGDYELLEEIARGGMGVVYRARQVNLNRIVALKMILAGQLASEEDVQRFRAEAEAAANLEHPGIVPVFEVGEHEGQHYFSMGFVEGESLADKIKDGPLPPRVAAEYTKRVADAMKYAHERGVIHRDLKPANVLLDQNDEPRVADFGLAKRVEGDSGLTATGQILGTPSYMPPEQASGRVDAITKASDIYSLGAILYALLTGRPPFQADNHLDTLMQVLEQEPVSPRQLSPKVSEDLETICLKCLEKEQSRRYPSTQEFADELRRYLDDEPIRARPLGPTARAWRWCRRKPAVATLLAVVMFSLAAATVCLLAGTGVSVYFAVQARNNEVRAVDKARELEATLNTSKLILTAMTALDRGETDKAAVGLQTIIDQIKIAPEAASQSSVWLVARHAMDHDETRDQGIILCAEIIHATETNVERSGDSQLLDEVSALLTKTVLDRFEQSAQQFEALLERGNNAPTLQLPLACILLKRNEYEEGFRILDNVWTTRHNLVLQLIEDLDTFYVEGGRTNELYKRISDHSDNATTAYATPLTGITIDGNLGDWPADMIEYSVRNNPNPYGPTDIDNVDLATSSDLSPSFRVGYDPAVDLIYVAMVVRDDQLVIESSRFLDIDMMEIYVDAPHSQRHVSSDFSGTDPSRLAAHQYLGTPGDSAAFRDSWDTNPAMLRGQVNQTKTLMGWSRQGNLTTYEWQVQAFDHYPDNPTVLKRGKRMGFDVAVVDRDGEGNTAWICWGPVGVSKFFNANLLGDLVLGVDW